MAKRRRPVEEIKANRILQAARLTLQNPSAAEERIAQQIIADWRKANSFEDEETDELEQHVLSDLYDNLMQKPKTLASVDTQNRPVVDA